MSSPKREQPIVIFMCYLFDFLNINGIVIILNNLFGRVCAFQSQRIHGAVQHFPAPFCTAEKRKNHMKKSLIIGVMGGGHASPANEREAYRLGCLIAQKGWILLNGGRNSGIMEASARGASDYKGITVGILPDENHRNVSEYIDIPILTGMGNARNCINVLSSDIVVACPGGAGTLSEIALALKNNKTVILMNFDAGTSFETFMRQGLLHYAQTPEQVIDMIMKFIH